MAELIERVEQEPKETGDVSLIGESGNSHKLSMQMLQDLYNEITGKTEEITKGYKSSYKITADDLKQLHIKITQLYEQYFIQSQNCSVTIFYEEDEKQVHSSFEKFECYDTSTLSPTESILFKYEFLIILPKTKRVQTYTLSIRIGSKITILKNIQENDPLPPEISRIIIGRTAQVAIKYVDYTVARNFMNTIDKWFKALDHDTSSKAFKILEKNSKYIPRLAKYMTLLVTSYLAVQYAPQYLSDNSVNLLILFNISVISFVCIFILFKLSEYLGKQSFENIQMMHTLSYVKLNRGDEKQIEKFEKKNSRMLFKAIVSLIASLSIGIISSIVATNIMT